MTEDEHIEREGSARAMPDPAPDVCPPEAAKSRLRAVVEVELNVAAPEPTSMFRPGDETRERTEAAVCMVCRKEYQVAVWAMNVARAWNRGERDLAAATEHTPHPHRPQFMGRDQLGTCGPECDVAYRRHLEKIAHDRIGRTDSAFRALRDGELTDDDASWLRQQGYGGDVRDYYAGKRRQANDQPHWQDDDR